MSSRHRDARRRNASLALTRATLLYVPVAATGKTSLFDPVAGRALPPASRRRGVGGGREKQDQMPLGSFRASAARGLINGRRRFPNQRGAIKINLLLRYESRPGTGNALHSTFTSS